jgi:hypothetical protein
MNGSASLMPVSGSGGVSEGTVRTSDLFNYQQHYANTSSVDLMNPSSSATNVGDHGYSNGRSVIHKSSGGGVTANSANCWQDSSAPLLEQQSYAETNLLTENGYIMNTTPTTDYLAATGNHMMPTSSASNHQQQQQQEVYSSSQQTQSQTQSQPTQSQPDTTGTGNNDFFTHVFHDTTFFDPFAGK